MTNERQEVIMAANMAMSQHGATAGPKTGLSTNTDLCAPGHNCSEFFSTGFSFFFFSWTGPP